MNQASHTEIAKMLNGFPQSAANVKALLLTYDEDLTGVSDQAIQETAQRFRRFEIPGQSKVFAPSSPEFVDAVRKQAELIAARNRPRLPAPVSRPNMSGKSPFEMRIEKAWRDYGHRQVLFENVSFDRFKALSSARTIPTGAQWVPCLGVVFGPEEKQQMQAAE